MQERDRKRKLNPNRIENGGDGTFVGKILRGMVDISPDILNILGTVTGVDSLNKLGDVIRGDKGISTSDKEILLAEIQKDVEIAREVTRRETEITLRWELDSKSQHWLPRLIRPLVVANFTILIDVVIISSMWGRPLGESYLPILMTMGVTAIGGYFTLREYGKNSNVIHK